MSWLRKTTRLISYSIKNHSLKIQTLQPRNPFQPRTNSFSTHSTKPNVSSTKSIHFNYSQPIFRNNFFNQNQSKILVFGVSKRFYYVGRPKVDRFKEWFLYQNRKLLIFVIIGSGAIISVYHFKKVDRFKKWLLYLRNVLIVVFIGSGVIISVYYGNIETVPYTKRTHIVLLSSRVERVLGDKLFNIQKAKKYKGKILPAQDPVSIRVQSILQDIVDALQEGLKKGQVWSEKLAKNKIIDEMWVEKTKKRMKSQTAHLEGLKWEVLVVEEPMVNAFSMPGGKIVVFTGLLNYLKTDVEVATIIGHEVGHAVARHLAEKLSERLWLTILLLVTCLLVNLDDVFYVGMMMNFLLRLPFSRRKEMEADYIGLLLVASAGYDPRLAPQVYEKLGNMVGDLKVQDYLASHPCGKTRAQKLAQAKVMEEAFGIYKEKGIP